jgi:hypothetical protein
LITPLLLGELGYPGLKRESGEHNPHRYTEFAVKSEKDGYRKEGIRT